MINFETITIHYATGASGRETLPFTWQSFTPHENMPQCPRQPQADLGGITSEDSESSPGPTHYWQDSRVLQIPFHHV